MHAVDITVSVLKTLEENGLQFDDPKVEIEERVKSQLFNETSDLRPTYANLLFLKEFIGLYYYLKFNGRISPDSRNSYLWYVAAVLVAFKPDEVMTECGAIGKFSLIDEISQYGRANKIKNPWINELSAKLQEPREVFDDERKFKPYYDKMLVLCPGWFESFNPGPAPGGRYFSLVKAGLEIIEARFLAVVKIEDDVGNVGSWKRILEFYFECSPKRDFYPIQGGRQYIADYQNVYIHLCQLWLQVSDADKATIEALIIENQVFLNEIQGYLIRSGPRLNEATGPMLVDLTRVRHGLLSQQPEQTAVLFPLMNLEAAMAVLGHFFMDQSCHQLIGDGPERLYWMLVAARTMSDKLAVFESTAEDLNDAEVLLAAAYGKEWLEQQKKVSALCGRIGVPYAWNEDTYSGEETFTAFVSAMAVVHQATNRTLGTGNNSLCCVRPPGHHHCKHPRGFCHANYVAVVAISLAKQGKNVLIVDCDAHFGDGTQAMIISAMFGENGNPDLAERIRFVNTFLNEGYPFRENYASSDFRLDAEKEENKKVIYNIPFENGSRAPRSEFQTKLAEIVRGGFKPDIAILSLGVDAHKEDRMTAGEWETEDYVFMMRESLAVCPHLSVISEGGYSEKALVPVIIKCIELLHESNVGKAQHSADAKNNIVDAMEAASAAPSL